jgi:hypothetical protein
VTSLYQFIVIGKGESFLPLQPAAGSSKDGTKKEDGEIKDEANITTQRIINDYSRYNPISTKPGEEDIRLLHIVPPDKEEELLCSLTDMPLNAGCVYIALSYCWGDMADQRTINLLHNQRANASFKTEDGEELIIGDVSTTQKFNVTSTLYQALKASAKRRPGSRNLTPSSSISHSGLTPGASTRMTS